MSISSISNNEKAAVLMDRRSRFLRCIPPVILNCLRAFLHGSVEHESREVVAALKPTHGLHHFEEVVTRLVHILFPQRIAHIGGVVPFRITPVGCPSVDDLRYGLQAVVAVVLRQQDDGGTHAVRHRGELHKLFVVLSLRHSLPIIRATHNVHGVVVPHTPSQFFVDFHFKLKFY